MPQVRTARKKNRRSDKRTNQKIRRRSDKRTNQKIKRRSDKRTNQKLGRRSDKRTNQKIRGREGLRINQKLVKRSRDKNTLVGGDYNHYIQEGNLPNFLLNDVDLVIPSDSRKKKEVNRIFDSVVSDDNWHSMIIQVYLYYNSLFMKYITTKKNISYIDDYNDLNERKRKVKEDLEILRTKQDELWGVRGSNREQLDVPGLPKERVKKLYEEKKKLEYKIQKLQKFNEEIKEDKSIDNFEHFKDYLDIISLFITFCILFNRLKINDIKLSDYFDEGEMKRIADNYAEIIKSTAISGDIKYKDQITANTFLDRRQHLFGSFPTFCCHKLGLKVYEIDLESLLNDYHEIINRLYTDFINYLKHSIISTYVLLEKSFLVKSKRFGSLILAYLFSCTCPATIFFLDILEIKSAKLRSFFFKSFKISFFKII